tara:strand:+ start:2512 stop:3525 length:1014 start_codon:yes stop_codon:yes gene_type:complete
MSTANTYGDWVEVPFIPPPNTLKTFYKFLRASKLKYSPNAIVNSDFLFFIYFYTSSQFKMTENLIDRIINKAKAFYIGPMQEELFTLISSFLRIRRFVQRRGSTKSNTFVNDMSLSFEPFTTSAITLKKGDKIYRFDEHEIIQIYRHSLLTISKHFYLLGTFAPPKNPYTNEDLTLKDNLTLYAHLKKSFLARGKYLPNYLEDYKRAYFSNPVYCAANLSKLLKYSLTDYVASLTEMNFFTEFYTMVHSSPVLLDMFCRRCYRRVSIQTIFLQSTVLYLLNSNNIYCFGTYTREFKMQANIHNLVFNKAHAIDHRRRLRAKHRVPTYQTLDTHPLSI